MHKRPANPYATYRVVRGERPKSVQGERNGESILCLINHERYNLYITRESATSLISSTSLQRGSLGTLCPDILGTLGIATVGINAPDVKTILRPRSPLIAIPFTIGGSRTMTK
ncbi:hypothetical protein WG66_009454 [Moniliophthora roreri]|nr:hypothetical protein WG66_009454 [Moniliophthora roreri]